MAAASTAAVATAPRRARVVRRAAAAATAPVAEKPKKKELPPEPPFDPATQPGVTLPLMYFDPAGLSKVGDKEGFHNLRCAELKHGRVAMLAAAGLVAQHYIHFPGFELLPNGAQAAITPPGAFGFVAVLALGAGIETSVWVQDKDKDPGDFGDPLGFGQKNTEWRNRELNNGRMAMFSFWGILAAEALTGKDAVDQLWTPLSNKPVE